MFEDSCDLLKFLWVDLHFIKGDRKEEEIEELDATLAVDDTTECQFLILSRCMQPRKQIYGPISHFEECVLAYFVFLVNMNPQYLV